MILNEWNFRSPERGYAMWLGHDLLGDLVLVRRWWGLSNGHGGQKVDVMLSEDEAIKRVLREIKLRKCHGYALCSN